MLVVVLEDGQGRVAAIQRVLSGRDHELRVFDRAPDFVEWLRGASGAALISLDYHLGPREAGTGLHAALALAAVVPFAPVILHSSDSTGARGQEEVLSAAGWETERFPFSESAWAASIKRRFP